jgi:excisionase family DNA binding protein
MARRTPISLHAAAERLGVHYMTVYRYVRTGRLPATREGAEWRVDPGDVDRLRRGQVAPAKRGSRSSAPARLERRLVAGDVPGAWAVVEDALVSGATPAQIHLDILTPALRSIGEGWADGRLTVADEHRATVTVQRIIGQLGPRFARRGRTRGTVVIGAPAGELHALPSSMLGDLLREAGYRVVDLGANTPPDSFVDAARDADRLVAVCIGITTGGEDHEAVRTIEALRAASITAPVFVGGAAITDADAAAALGADGWSGLDARSALAAIDADA